MYYFVSLPFPSIGVFIFGLCFPYTSVSVLDNKDPVVIKYQCGTMNKRNDVFLIAIYCLLSYFFLAIFGLQSSIYSLCFPDIEKNVLISAE